MARPEQTEKATPKRQSEARGRGQVARSPDVGGRGDFSRHHHLAAPRFRRHVPARGALVRRRAAERERPDSGQHPLGLGACSPARSPPTRLADLRVRRGDGDRHRWRTCCSSGSCSRPRSSSRSSAGSTRSRAPSGCSFPAEPWCSSSSSWRRFRSSARSCGAAARPGAGLLFAGPLLALRPDHGRRGDGLRDRHPLRAAAVRPGRGRLFLGEAPSGRLAEDDQDGGQGRSPAARRQPGSQAVPSSSASVPAPAGA